jgi:hypothetical protein
MVGFTYKSYNFVDKDPIIDEVRTVFAQSGATYRWVEEHSGVTHQTLRNWFDGETKRPQAASINAVLRSLGFKLGVVPFEQSIAVTPPAPQPASIRHVVQMARYKKG